MKAKTKKKIQQWVFYGLIGVFILGTLLLYLPVGNQSQQTTPPVTNPGVQGGASQGGQSTEAPPGPPVQQNQAIPGQSGQPAPAAPGGLPFGQ